MHPRPPAIAAHHSRTSLAVVAELSPGAEPRVRARLRPESREALDGAARSDFLPADVDLDVATAIRDELGDDAARRVARETVRRSFTGTLLGGLVQSAGTLFGLTPPGLLRWASPGWRRVCRDCGELRLAGQADELVILELDDLPEPLGAPHYLEAVAGGLEAILDVCQVDGVARMLPRPGGARFELSWRPTRETPPP